MAKRSPGFMDIRREEGRMRSFFLAFLMITFPTVAVAGTGCSSKNSIQANQDGGPGGTGSTNVSKDDYCSSCTFNAQASLKECKAPRAVNACCVCVAPPSQDVKRGLNLHYFSSKDNPNVDLGCL